MQNITLNITRKKSFVGAAMSYRVLLNGNEIAKVANGKSVSVQIPGAQATLMVSMVGNALTFHKIEKEVVLFPQPDTTQINCLIETKGNAFGILTSGLFAAVGKVELTVDYQ